MFQKVDGEVFFNKLYEDENFCQQLGKVILSASKLEAIIIRFLNNKNIDDINKKATLGQLIEKIKIKKLLDKNILVILKELSSQRNYLTHNIYLLLLNMIDETVLERNELCYEDVHLYAERAYILADNLNAISEIVKNELK